MKKNIGYEMVIEKPVYYDFDRETHCFISGTTGTGMQCTIRDIVLRNALTKKDLYIIDLKKNK